MERNRSSELTPRQKAERAFLQENIEDLRSRQQDILNDDSLSNDERTQKLDESVNEYLGDYGLNSDADKFQEYVQIIRNLSVDHINHLQWRYGEWDAANQTNVGKTGFDKLHDEQESLFGHQIYEVASSSDTDSLQSEDDPVSLNDQEKAERQAELESEVTELRSEWADASASRGSKPFGKKSTDFDDLEKRYHNAVNELGRFHIHHSVDGYGDMTDQEKNFVVVSYLFTEQGKLRDETTEHLNKTPVGKFVKFMNKGKFATRMLKGLGLGIAAGATGAFIASGVGAGILAGGAVAASRFARGYAQHDKRGVRSAQDHFDESAVTEALNEESVELGDDQDDKFEAANRHFTYLYEDEVKDQQKKRRKAFVWGAGSVAAGATLGYIGHGLLEQKIGRSITLTDAVTAGQGEAGFWDKLDTESDGILDNGTPKDHDGDGILNGLDEDYNSAEDGGKPHAGDINQNDIPDVDESGTDKEPQSTIDAKNDLVGEIGADENELYVDPDHGYTHELVQFAEANGQNLSPQQSYQLHLALVEEYGNDYIDIKGQGNDIYYHGDDIRLREPGVGLWKEGVPEFSMKWMQDNGLWHQKVA